MTRFSHIEEERPVLTAAIRGMENYKEIVGEVCVYMLSHGMCFCANISNLPPAQSLTVHIHEGFVCENAGGHFLDLPDIISDKLGEAYALYYFDKRSLYEIAGRVIMFHIKKDGEEPAIACGVLKRVL
ncbi:MAG: superoxide dismutase family protein [Oscillospiraceae bacterium]|nr:superoxide dismutase family protein [Oscillospiraceae bacterium]